jgi:hypothetical protein
MKKLKYVKLFEDFSINEKWILGINESIFDKIESLVKGKSDKGKIIAEFLSKNGIKETGSFHKIIFLGGANPGKEELSNPFDYLQYTPGIAKITDEGVLELVDEKSKKMKAPDTISFMMAVTPKEEIDKNFTLALKPGSSVHKSDYSFDLSKDKPTLKEFNESMWSMKDQKWVETHKSLEREYVLGEDIDMEGDLIFFKSNMPIITLQQWVDKLNETGWVKEDTDYFKKNIK